MVLDTAVDKFWRDGYFHAAWKRSREVNHCDCLVVAECDQVKSSNAIMTMKWTVVVRETVKLVVERHTNRLWERLVKRQSKNQ